MRKLSHNFLKSKSTDILETMFLFKDEIVHDSVICNNS